VYSSHRRPLTADSIVGESSVLELLGAGDQSLYFSPRIFHEGSLCVQLWGIRPEPRDGGFPGILLKDPHVRYYFISFFFDARGVVRKWNSHSCYQRMRRGKDMAEARDHGNLFEKKKSWSEASCLPSSSDRND
jgi:hypothetical protein